MHMVRTLALDGVDLRSTSALLAALRDAPVADAELLALMPDPELRSLAEDAGLRFADRAGLTASLEALREGRAPPLALDAVSAAPVLQREPPVPPSVPVAPCESLAPSLAQPTLSEPLRVGSGGPQTAFSFEQWLQSRPAPQRRAPSSRRRAEPARARLPGRDDEAFVAIDFETADAKRDSACAVALVRVERGEIVHRAATLIRPPRPDVPNAWVHGLTWEKLAPSPTFAEIWPQLTAMLEGVDYLVAHNAPFDRSVLRACCAAAGLAEPPMPFECTLQMARSLWGMSGATLPALCERFGIPLVHHDAGSDAEACARLVLAARRLLREQDAR